MLPFYKLTGVYKSMTTPETKVSAAGNEYKIARVIIDCTEGGDTYPSLIELTAFNETIDVLQTINYGTRVNVTAKLKCREYNGRYYTDVNLYDVAAEAGAPGVSSSAAPAPTAPAKETDDLPF